MRRPTALVLTRLKRLARLLTNEGLTPPSVLYYLAVIVAWLNRPALAGSIADAALKAADRSSNRRMFMVRQRWQFEAERWFYLAGKARVDDPLFLCCCVPMPSSKVSEAGFREAPGHYEGLWTYRGLRLDGFLTPVEGGAKYVRILVDGVLIKELTVARRTAIPPFFQLTLQRDTVAALSPTCTVEIQLPDGRRLLSGGCEQVQIKVPHGDGRIRSGLSVDKKGYLVEVGQPLEERQAAFLEIYEQASAYFRLQERSLFLLYGTLLGFHREGDFIAGDDDFDVGYFSQQADPRRSDGVGGRAGRGRFRREFQSERATFQAAPAAQPTPRSPGRTPGMVRTQPHLDSSSSETGLPARAFRADPFSEVKGNSCRDPQSAGSIPRRLLRNWLACS